MSTTEMVGALNAAGVCEVVWTTPDGRPDAVATTPLVHDDRPALAFPYAYAQLARAIGSARQVAIVVSDPRLSASSWRPLAVFGRPGLVEDVEGSLFAEHLLNQELRKHPPSRTLADSPMLRREHWWFVPRLVVSLEPEAVVDVASRVGGATDGVVAAALPTVSGPGEPHLRVATVSVGHSGGPDLSLGLLGASPSTLADVHGRAGVVLCHDFSTPDVERWTSWTARGRVRSDGDFSTPDSLGLRIESQAGSAELPPPLSLVARFRRQRSFSRECRHELR